MPKIWRRRVHTFSSWRLAKSSVLSGQRARNQKLALVAPHMRRRRHAAWGSFTRGMRSRGPVVPSTWSPRNAERMRHGRWEPQETFNPCWTGGNKGSPRHTTASGFNARAAWVMASTPLGSVPPLFQTCVLPRFRWMRAWAHNSSSAATCNLSTLVGRDTV